MDVPGHEVWKYIKVLQILGFVVATTEASTPVFLGTDLMFQAAEKGTRNGTWLSAGRLCRETINCLRII